MVSAQNARRIAVNVCIPLFRKCVSPLFRTRNADRLRKALKHLTKTPRVYSRTPSLIDPPPTGRWIISKHKVSGPLKPNGQSGRQAKVAPLKVGRACLEFVGLKPPPEQPHQSEIDSYAEIFSKGGIRPGCCRTVFACVYGADQ